MSAPTLIQSKKTAFATAADFSATFTSPNTLGSVLLAMSYNNGGANTPTVGDTAGNTWTLLDQLGFGGANNKLGIFICSSSLGGANTVTYHAVGSGSGDLVIAEYSAGTLDKHNITSGNSTTPTSPSVNTTSADEVLAGSIASAGGSLAAAGGFASQQADAGFFLFEDKTVASTGAYTASATAASAFWAAGIVTLKATGGAPPPAAPPVVCIMQ
jgi:hypothetical protein